MDGRKADGRTELGLGNLLIPVEPGLSLTTGACISSTIKKYQNCRNCCAWFRAEISSGNKLRAHSLSGRASLTLSLTSDWTYDKLTEASLCQHSTAPPPDLLLVDARRLMTTSILAQSFVDLSQSPFPFLSLPSGPGQR